MVIAFIPVRGGSKSIPLKNIKLFCGKPLVCWSIEALEQCEDVDEIIVATDSDSIEKIVTSQTYRKTKIYRRSTENASDTATTESVMLEYIHYAQISQQNTFILVQATSPMTESFHFSEALKMYRKGKYDSLLTCVRNYRFYWSENGTSMNYDYMNRPRRQDFSGILMENGAFYINTVGNIIKFGNRLCGHIGIYEMPDYTALEIDEPDDWIVLESFMRKYVLPKRMVLQNKINLFLCDVDGTLTDGGMYYSEFGDELKKYNTRDGVAFELLRKEGIKTGIITSENKNLNKRRAQKLQIDFLIQGKKERGKLEAALDICNHLGVSIKNVAYIGDDVNCVELLSAVGLAACPSDADESVKAVPNIFKMEKKGGEGCVREFVEYYILKDNGFPRY